ncbi:MAG: septal ring lytic transglycosylase RlpA family protein [Agarilytica sp.]
MRRVLKSVSVTCAIVLLTACENLWVVEEQDRGPDQPLDVSHIKEPIPREELRTIAGNKTPYKVLGKTYHILSTPEGYREKGVASWYGEKFHGRHTANGEIYNMYGMTAAHKTLPIPSYVRVTNIENRRSIIVRVNDRGPFHGDRVIDLTYTAAKKLGYERSGTAKVSLEYIDPSTYHATHPQSSSGGAKVANNGVSVSGSGLKAPEPEDSGGYKLPENTYLQAGAFGKKASAEAFKVKLKTLSALPIRIRPPSRRKDLYIVQIGPVTSNLQVLELRQKLLDANYPAPHVVREK